MKKLLFLFCFIATTIVSFGQQSGVRYEIVPEGGGQYQVPNKEIQTISYAATKTVTTTHEETIAQFAQLTGALTINATVTDCYKGDKLYFQFATDATIRTVTFNTNFLANGTLAIPASSWSAVIFMFNGAKWVEVTRTTSSTSLFGDGTVSAPSISFVSDPDNGLYRIGTNNIGVAAAGAKVLDIGTTGLGVVGVVKNGNGTVSLPAFSYTADTDCGDYYIGTNNIGTAVNGAKVLDISTTGLGVTGTTTTGAGLVTAPGLAVGANDNGWYEVSSTQQGMSIGNSLVGGWNASGLFTGAITEQISGSGISFTKQIIQHRTATTYTATGTYTVTAAELNKGLLVAATATATTTMTLPTATDIGTQISAGAGTTFDFVVSNASAADNGTVTVAVGVGITASDFPGTNTLTRTGSVTVGIAVFRLTFISATVAVLTRIS